MEKGSSSTNPKKIISTPCFKRSIIYLIESFHKTTIGECLKTLILSINERPRISLLERPKFRGKKRSLIKNNRTHTNKTLKV